MVLGSDSPLATEEYMDLYPISVNPVIWIPRLGSHFQIFPLTSVSIWGLLYSYY